MHARWTEWCIVTNPEAFPIFDQLFSATEELTVDRDAAWAKPNEANKELADLRSRYQTLEGSAKRCETQSSSILEKAKAKWDEFELEQRPFKDEIIDEWLKSEEGKAATNGLARPYIKSGYHRDLRCHLPEVPFWRPSGAGFRRPMQILG